MEGKDEDVGWQNSCGKTCSSDKQWACRKLCEQEARHMFWKHKDNKPQDHYDVWIGSCGNYFRFFEKDYVRREEKPIPVEPKPLIPTLTMEEREARKQKVIEADVRSNIKRSCLRDGVSFNQSLEPEDSQGSWKEFEER